MLFSRNDGDWEFHLEGPISERTDLFSHDMRKARSILIDMQRTTYINSIGVKNWISWTLSIPYSCKIQLRNCPFVIISQINMVHGFIPKNATVESFYAPYTNADGDELIRHLVRGVDYEYGSPGVDPMTKFLETYIDPVTQEEWDPDFIPEKVVKMLRPS